MTFIFYSCWDIYFESLLVSECERNILGYLIIANKKKENICFLSCRGEKEIVPQVIQAILTLPAEMHVAVHYTSTHLMGELCEWIEQHPQLLGNI